MAVSIVTTSVPHKTEIRVRTHVAITDATAAAGGGDTAPTPHELFHGSIGACVAITLGIRAQKKGYDLKKVTVTVTKTLVDDPNDASKKIPLLTQDVVLEGKLSDAELADLESAAKTCPVHREYAEPKLTKTSVTRV